MKIVKFIAVLGLVSLISACSGTVKTMPENSSYKYNGEQYGVVSISLAQAKISDEGSFNAEVFKTTLENTLKEQGLMSDGQQTTLRVDLKNVNLRSQGAAVLLGFLAGSDTIEGTVTLLDANNQIINKFDVDASYAAGGLIGGQDGMRMDWLYAKFAELTWQTIKGS